MGISEAKIKHNMYIISPLNQINCNPNKKKTPYNPIPKHPVPKYPIPKHPASKHYYKKNNTNGALLSEGAHKTPTFPLVFFFS